MRVTALSVLFCLLPLPVAAASSAATPDAVKPPALAYLATWPHKIDVVDLNKGEVVDRIDVNTDVVRRLILSPDHKKLYASTMAHNGFATVDLATRKVSDYFDLDHDNQQIRLAGDAIDPSGRYIYSIATTVTKNIDYYDISQPHFVVIDLEKKAIVRTADLPKGENPPSYRSTMRISPDGKYLYLLRNNIQVFNTSDFHLVKTIGLERPADPNTLDVSFEAEDDPNESPDKVIGLFRSSDPFVYRETFGIGEIDLSTLDYNLTPVGPVTTTLLSPLMLNPDRTRGYTAVVNGVNGNRVTEFWVFDMKDKKLIDQHKFTGRTRFNFGMSADGTKLLIYNAGYQVEIYDTKTLEMTKDIDLEGDTTSNLIVMPESQ